MKTVAFSFPPYVKQNVSCSGNGRSAGHEGGNEQQNQIMSNPEKADH